MLLPSFTDWSTLYDLQDVLLGDDPEAAKTAVGITMYGSGTDPEMNEGFTSELNSIQSSLYDELVWPEDAKGEFSFPTPYKTDDGEKKMSDSCLVAHRDENNALVLSVMAAGVINSTPGDQNSVIMVGLMNHHACARTEELDSDGILGGEIRFSIVDYSGTAPPNRFRFLSSKTPKKVQNLLMESLSPQKEDASGKKKRDRRIYRGLMNGSFLSEASSGPGNWIIQHSTASSSFEFTLPAIYPLPARHNITLLSPALISSADGGEIANEFIDKGAKTGSDLSYLTTNPHFLTWIHALLTDASPCVPTSIKTVTFNNFPTRDTYRKGVISYRKVAIDWLSSVKNITALEQAFIDEPTIVLQEFFPPEGLDYELVYPPFTPTRSFPEDRAASLRAAVPATQSFRGHGFRSSPVTVTGHDGSLSSNDNMEFFSNIANITSSSSNKEAMRTWITMGIIAYQGRSARGEEGYPFDVLTASTDPVTLWIGGAAGGTPTPIKEELKTHFICGPLSNIFNTALKSKHRKAPESFANTCESRLSNFKADGSAPAAIQRLKADLNSFFNVDIFSRIITGALNQKGLNRQNSVPIEHFSLLHLSLLSPSIKFNKEDYSPFLPKDGLATYDALESILQGIKWFLMTIFHAQWYQHTILYKGISYLETLCEERNFRTGWDSEGFNRAAATYRIFVAIHDLGALVAAMANHLPEEELLEANYLIKGYTDLQLCYLAPHSFQESGYKAILYKDLSQWTSQIPGDLNKCAGSQISSFAPCFVDKLIVEHPLLGGNSAMIAAASQKGKRKSPEQSNHSSDDEAATKKSQQEAKRLKQGKEKPTQALAPQAVLKPAAGKTVGELLAAAQNDRRKFNWRLKKGKELKGMRQNCRLCFPYLLGAQCPGVKCGYHLSLDSTMMKEVEDWTLFTSWVEQMSEHICFSEEAIATGKFSKT